MQFAEQLQENKPIFVRNRYKPIIWKHVSWKFEDNIPWQEMDIPIDVVKAWWSADLIMHSAELEKQQKVGDRLEEMNKAKLDTLYNLLNAVVKKQTSSTSEYKEKKIKFSQVEDRQRGLIRQWLGRNAWAMEDFYKYRDQILGETVSEDTE